MKTTQQPIELSFTHNKSIITSRSRNWWKATFLWEQVVLEKSHDRKNKSNRSQIKKIKKCFCFFLSIPFLLFFLSRSNRDRSKIYFVSCAVSFDNDIFSLKEARKTFSWKILVVSSLLPKNLRNILLFRGNRNIYVESDTNKENVCNRTLWYPYLRT